MNLFSACWNKMAPPVDVVELVKIENAVSATLQLLKIAGGKESSLFPEEDSVNLAITLKHIPPVKFGNWKGITLTLPFSPWQKSISVCLFVNDLDKKKNGVIDNDVTIRFYKEILENYGITCISEIIPLYMLRTEYKPFEAKRKLALSYDMFLADARIYGYLPSLLGKEFKKRKKLPLKINVRKLNSEIPKALQKTTATLHNTAAACQLAIGRFDQRKEEIVQNVAVACRKLSSVIPGGWSNINTLHIKSRLSVAIPVYIAADFSVDPRTENQKKVVSKIEPEEVSTVSKGKVIVYARGKTKVVKDPNDVDDDGSDDESDDDGSDDGNDNDNGEESSDDEIPAKRVAEKRKNTNDSSGESEAEDDLKNIEDKHVGKWLRVDATVEKEPKDVAKVNKKAKQKKWKKNNRRKLQEKKNSFTKSKDKTVQFAKSSNGRKTEAANKSDASKVKSNKQQGSKTKGRFNLKRKQKKNVTVNGLGKKKS